MSPQENSRLELNKRDKLRDLLSVKEIKGLLGVARMSLNYCRLHKDAKGARASLDLAITEMKENLYSSLGNRVQLAGVLACLLVRNHGVQTTQFTIGDTYDLLPWHEQGLRKVVDIDEEQLAKLVRNHQLQCFSGIGVELNVRSRMTRVVLVNFDQSIEFNSDEVSLIKSRIANEFSAKAIIINQTI